MSFQSEKGTVTTAISDKIATITFGHPASNSFPASLLQKLTCELNEVSNRSDVRIVILQSFGTSTFCAGASFDELLNIDNIEQGTIFFSGFANVINAMRTCQKLIIGRVQGKAVGGGVGLASACDYVFATTAASIKLSEIAIGIGPFVIEPAVSRKIGKNAMMKLTLNPSAWMSAQWATEHELYSEIFEDIPSMDVALQAFADKLCQYNPTALIEMKKVYWEKTSHWNALLMERAAISGKLVLSAEAQKALMALKR